MTKKLALAALASLLTVVAACGSGTAPGPGAAGLPAVLTLQAIQDLTGPAGYAGVAVQQGAMVALEEINTTRFLGATTLGIDYSDTRSDRQQAGILASRAVASGTPLLLGTVASTSGQVMSPIVERAALPTIYTISTANGVNIGRYTYRSSVPASNMVPALAPVLVARGITTMSIIHDSDSDGTVLLGTKAMPELARRANVRVLGTRVTQSTQGDYAAVVAATLADKPGAVAIAPVTEAGGTGMIRALRLAGFTGPIVASGVLATGAVKALGAAAGDVFWTVAFHKDRSSDATRHFDALFRAKYDADPNEYHASGYDQVWTAARALKAASSVDRAAVLQGLEKVAAEGFSGSSQDLRYTDRDLATASPAVVAWVKDHEQLQN
ncbi:hypothetical protein GCM10009836_56620 [Pseudonocardia ailaonensis]|uniref:Leucine-binding protein domain-containing protein n=1 Tax=Pseudonocardia ailaonensis TaxID=367279 RepID=A0ABN2NIX5_9PSEU